MDSFDFASFYTLCVVASLIAGYLGMSIYVTLDGYRKERHHRARLAVAARARSKVYAWERERSRQLPLDLPEG